MNLDLFTPHVGEATANPFFLSNPQEVTKREDGPAPCRALLPEYFAPLYASYADDVEFRDDVSGLVLMSISEINRRSQHLPESCVDFGFKYAGMGHVRLFTDIPEKGVIVEAMDGGSNDLDRAYNMRTRHRALTEFIQTGEASLDLRVFDVTEWVGKEA